MSKEEKEPTSGLDNEETALLSQSFSCIKCAEVYVGSGMIPENCHRCGRKITKLIQPASLEPCVEQNPSLLVSTSVNKLVALEYSISTTEKLTLAALDRARTDLERTFSLLHQAVNKALQDSSDSQDPLRP